MSIYSEAWSSGSTNSIDELELARHSAVSSKRITDDAATSECALGGCLSDKIGPSGMLLLGVMSGFF